MTERTQYPVVIFSPDDTRLLLDALSALRSAKLAAWCSAREQAVPEKRALIEQGVFGIPEIDALIDRFQVEDAVQFIALLSQSKLA